MKLNQPEVAALVAMSEEMEAYVEADWFSRLPRVTRDLEQFRQAFDDGADEIVAGMRVVNFFLGQGDEVGMTGELRDKLMYI